MRFRLDAPERQTDRRAAMGAEVRAGLARRPRSIPSKYFYDAPGSQLFDRICALPEYYLTRTEHALLAAHAAQIAEVTAADSLLEIGSGMARKTGLVVGAMCDRERRNDVVYVPFDISREAIEVSARALMAVYPRLRVHGVIGDFGHDLPRIVRSATEGPRLLAFLGSTIGNLDERAAPEFLGQVSALMRDDDWFLLGVDLVKDERVLHAAYNDSEGVTAEFNLNILRVLARELDGDLDPAAFSHVAFYDPAHERIEMHVEAKHAHRVFLRAIDLAIDFEAGERVMTEISRKFTRASIEGTLAGGGMRLERWLADDQFALALARRA